MHNTFEDLRKTKGKGEVLEILKCGKWGSLKEEKEGTFKHSKKEQKE